jgi:DnaJ-class molecular chaperone
MTVQLQERRTQPTSTVRECMWCFGSGRVPNDDAQRYEPCEMCQGTGVRTARRRPDLVPIQLADAAA